MLLFGLSRCGGVLKGELRKEVREMSLEPRLVPGAAKPRFFQLCGP